MDILNKLEDCLNSASNITSQFINNRIDWNEFCEISNKLTVARNRLIKKIPSKYKTTNIKNVNDFRRLYNETIRSSGQEVNRLVDAFRLAKLINKKAVAGIIYHPDFLLTFEDKVFSGYEKKEWRNIDSAMQKLIIKYLKTVD